MGKFRATFIVFFPLGNVCTSVRNILRDIKKFKFYPWSRLLGILVFLSHIIMDNNVSMCYFGQQNNNFPIKIVKKTTPLKCYYLGLDLRHL